MHKFYKRLFWRSFAFAGALTATLSSGMAQQPVEDIAFRPSGLDAMTIPSTSCTGFWKTASFQCRAIHVPAYLARAKDGNRSAIVILSGNAGGMDKRHVDYARFLADNNINAIAIDSFAARGHNGGVGADLIAGRNKGLDAVNQSIDALTVASRLAASVEWAGARIGYLGESMSGSAAINVVRPYIAGIVSEQNPGLKVRDMDAVAALYPACLDRNTIERFKRIPFLLVQPEKDDITPPANCQRQVEWMNGRGGDATMVIVPGEYHDYDGPWPLKSMNSQNTSRCSNLRDGEKFILESTGKEFPATPQGYNDMNSTCITRGFMTGNRGKERVGYDLWLAFFQKSLVN